MENRDNPDPDLARGSVPEGWAERPKKTPKQNPAPSPASPLSAGQETAAIIVIGVLVLIVNDLWIGSAFVFWSAIGVIGVRLLWWLIYSAVRAGRDQK